MIVRRLLVLVVALTVAMAMAIPAGAAKPAPSLSGTSHHDAGGGDIGLPDFQFQAWEGTISFGDEVFDIEWWFDVNTWTAWPPVFGEFPPNASQYTMEVRVFDKDGKTVLRTLEHGTTTIANLTWRANGKVVHAEGFFEGWEGRRVHESGVFVMHDSGFFPVSGDSSFRIN